MAKPAPPDPLAWIGSQWLSDFPPHFAGHLLRQVGVTAPVEGMRILRMLRAIEEGEVEAVRQCLADGIDVNLKLPEPDRSFLHLALSRKRPRLVDNLPAIAQVLIDAGADLKSDPTLLAEVAHPGFEATFDLLLRAGAVLDGSALAAACWTGNAPVVERLLRNGVDPDTQTDICPDNRRTIGSCTLLMAAAFLGFVPIAKLLLAAGADRNRMDEQGGTAGDWARRCRDKKSRAAILPLLESSGASNLPAEAKTVDFPAAARSKAFRQAIASLEALLGQKARRTLELEERTLNGIAAFPLEKPAALEFVDKHQPAFLKQGFLLLFTNLLPTPDGWGILLVPTSNPFVAIHAIETAGPNSGVTTADLIRWLQDLERSHPFQLIGIGEDFIEARFRSAPGNPSDLARRILAFAPDGAAGLKPVAYARALTRSRRLFLWWG